MPDDLAPFDDLASVFKALSDPTRLAILVLLLEHDELCVCDIEKVLGITQSRSSRHLRYLLNAGLVSTKRVGQWAHYRVAPTGPQRQAILQSLRNTLSPEDLRPLEDRLAAWKKLNHSTCSVSPSR
jgi:ArsR family transcriptional regulator